MGKKVQAPRYNVISARTSDSELREIRAAIGNGNCSSFVLEATLEKARKILAKRTHQKPEGGKAAC